MKVRESIFGSNSERKNYYRLLRRWGKDYHIHQNHPFLMLFDVSPDEVGGKQFFNYLAKTSIDYLICDENDKPLIGIDFDGMQQGKNIGDKYVPSKGFDEKRAWGFETKLRIAAQANFPYLVVGDEEFDLISGTRFTLIDCLVGTFLAKNAFDREFSFENFEVFLNSHYELTLEQYEALNSEEQRELVKDFGITTEVHTELDNNPLVEERWRIQRLMINATPTTKGGYKTSELIWGMGGVPVSDPDRFVAGRFMFSHPEYGTVEKQIILSRSGSRGMRTSGKLAMDIAALLAAMEMAKRMQISI
jgi:hypothetical protein